MYAGSMRSSNDRSKEDALQFIEELKSAVEEGGLSELANSLRLSLGTEGGDLGSFGRGQMVLSSKSLHSPWSR